MTNAAVQRPRASTAAERFARDMALQELSSALRERQRAACTEATAAAAATATAVTALRGSGCVAAAVATGAASQGAVGMPRVASRAAAAKEGVSHGSHNAPSNCRSHTSASRAGGSGCLAGGSVDSAGGGAVILETSSLGCSSFGSSLGSSPASGCDPGSRAAAVPPLHSEPRPPVPAASAATSGATAEPSADRLRNMESDVSRLTSQVAILRQTLSNEIQSFRQGLATIADAVKAVRPLIDAEGEQRCESESRLAETLGRSLQDLRTEVSELTPLKALKSELADLASLRVKPRLLALEREMRELGEQRRRNRAMPGQGSGGPVSASPPRPAPVAGGGTAAFAAGSCAAPCCSCCCYASSCSGGCCTCCDSGDEAGRVAEVAEATEERLQKACREICDEAREEARAVRVKCAEDVEQQRQLLQVTEGGFQRTLQAAHDLRGEAQEELRAVRRMGAEDVEQHRQLLQASEQGFQWALRGFCEEARTEACEEAVACAEAQTTANRDLHKQLAAKIAAADAARVALDAELSTSRAASKKLSHAQARLGEAFQEAEATLSNKVRAAVVTAEGAAAAELSAELHAGICRAHSNLKAELAVAASDVLHAGRGGRPSSPHQYQRLAAAGCEVRAVRGARGRVRGSAGSAVPARMCCSQC